MSRLVDNYNANECCKSLKEIKRSIKIPLKKRNSSEQPDSDTGAAVKDSAGAG